MFRLSPSSSINSEQDYTILSLDDQKFLHQNYNIQAMCQFQSAKQKFYSLINAEELDEAWIWLSRFLNVCFG